MIIQKTNAFEKRYKKLHKAQQKEIQLMIHRIRSDVSVGDLADVSVYKFFLSSQLTLLAYTYQPTTDTLILLQFGPHENFYRDLKRIIH